MTAYAQMDASAAMVLSSCRFARGRCRPSGSDVSSHSWMRASSAPSRAPSYWAMRCQRCPACSMRSAAPSVASTDRIGAGAVVGRRPGEREATDWDLPDLTLMMLATGCRIGECLAIGWSEVDLDGAAVDVRWRLVRRTGVGLLRLPSTKSGRKGERLIPLPSWAVTMLRRRRLAIGPGVEAVFPDSLGNWRDPSNVRRVWREVRDELELEGFVSHTLRKTVASFLDDADVSTRKISDQLGHAKISMTQDRYLGRRLTDRQTAEVLEGLFGAPGDEKGPKSVHGS